MNSINTSTANPADNTTDKTRPNEVLMFLAIAVIETIVITAMAKKLQCRISWGDNRNWI